MDSSYQPAGAFYIIYFLIRGWNDESLDSRKSETGPKMNIWSFSISFSHHIPSSSIIFRHDLRPFPWFSRWIVRPIHSYAEIYRVLMRTMVVNWWFPIKLPWFPMVFPNRFRSAPCSARTRARGTSSVASWPVGTGHPLVELLRSQTVGTTTGGCTARINGD